MAYGGYGKNSPPYTGTTEPYTPPVKPTPTPVHVPVSGGPVKEHCGNCGRAVETDFLCCPYCRHDLQAARKLRTAKTCRCGAVREENAKHCFKCGTRNT
jgi:RNA polymerase subunit RPABC4/transcription elongation factor Spt4